MKVWLKRIIFGFLAILALLLLIGILFPEDPEARAAREARTASQRTERALQDSIRTAEEAVVPTQELIAEIVRSEQVGGDERSISADIILVQDVSPSDVLRLARAILSQYTGVVLVSLWEKKEHYAEDLLWQEMSLLNPTLAEPSTGRLFVLMRSPSGAESGLWFSSPEGPAFSDVSGTTVTF